MTRVGSFAFALVGLAPATAVAEQVCGTVDEFNTAMADGGTAATDVTLTFDVVGVNPNDFPGTKGSLAQFRDTLCAAGADMGIKVYGLDPANTSHPTGTLKMEYGNQCCGGACGENWADPVASAPVFFDGTETCNVKMWVSPMDAGYSLACSSGQFDALGGNPEANAVNQINLLTFLLPDGGSTWTLTNATASNDMVCWDAIPSDMMSITVPVMEDVASGPAWPDLVFPDVTDLAVEADGTLAYLKFDVPPIDGKITKTRLFMRSSTAPSSDGDGGEVHAVADSTWSEGTLSYNTRPEYDAFSLGRIGPAAADVLVSLELSTPLDGDGLHSFAVFSPATDGNGTHFWSKEGSPDDAAYLKIDYMVVDADGDGANDGPDCDDADPNVNPSATEACNGIDDDCDGDTDEGCDGVDSGGTDGAGGTDGGTDGSDDGAGTGSAGQDDGPVLPGGGSRGADTGCGCATTPSHGAWLFAFASLALTRRRRR